MKRLLLSVIILTAVVTSCKKNKEAPKNETIDRENAIIIEEVCNKRLFRTDTSESYAKLKFSTKIIADSLIWNLGAEEFKNPKSIIRTEFIGKNNFSVSLRIMKKQADGSILRDTFKKDFYIYPTDTAYFTRGKTPMKRGFFYGAYDDEPNLKIIIAVNDTFEYGDTTVFIGPTEPKVFPNEPILYLRNIPYFGIYTDSLARYGLSTRYSTGSSICSFFEYDKVDCYTKKYKKGFIIPGFNFYFWKIYHTNQYQLDLSILDDLKKTYRKRTFKGIKIK